MAVDKTKIKDASVGGDLVQEAMGNFGPWHLLIVVSLSLVKFPVAWHQLSIVFVAPKTDFNCSQWNSHDYGPGSSKCEIKRDGNIEKCTRFDYDESVFLTSAVTQWDLVCDREQLANILQTLTMFGILVGNMIFGMIADRLGRKIPLVIAVLIQSLSGLLSAFAPWYELFLLLKFITAVATGGTMLTSFVLIMEIVGVKWRPICSVLFHVPFIVGHMISALISYLTRTWTGYQIAVSIPSILLLVYYWIIPESPRWLLAVGKIYKAEEILIEAANRNKISLDKVRDAIDAQEILLANRELKEPIKKYNITHLFRTPNLRIKTFCICINWLACGICFFGVTHYVGTLSGNIFLNVAASTAMELPGTVLVLFLISRVSRLKILIGGNLLSGISLLLLTLVIDNSVAKICLATLALVGMSISFPTVYLYSTEAFPTVVRNVGLGLASLCSRTGSMVTPYIVSSASVQPWLPAFIFCIGPLIGAGLCVFLPETMDCDLPETIEDGENFGKEKRSTEEGNN